MNLISCILPYLEKHWNNWLKHLLLLTGTKLLPRCESGCIYLFSKITCMRTSSLTCPEQFFRAIWEAVSGGYAPQYVPKQNWNSQLSVQFSSVQSLSRVWLFATPWTAARQASLSITNFQSLLKLVSIELVMPSNHLILSSPSPPAFNLSQHQGLFQLSQFFESGGQSIGVSVLASVLPMNIQDRFPLGWAGWISLQSKRLSGVFSNTTVQKH